MPMKPLLRNKFKPQNFRGDGLLPSSRLPRKVQLRQNFRNYTAYRPEQLPSKVDLRPDMTPVEEQSTIGSW